MTLDEVAKWLRLNKATVYRMVRLGQLPAFRFGRNFRFRRSDLEASLKQSRAHVADDERWTRPRTEEQQTARLKRGVERAQGVLQNLNNEEDYDAWLSR